MPLFTDEISVPIGFLYGIVGLIAMALVVVGAAFYKTRRYYEQFDLDLPPQGYDGYLPKKKVNWADNDLQGVVSLNPQSVQPHTSLRNKIKENLPWKSATQHVIDTLKPEVVEEYRGRLNFSLSYSTETETLFVNIIQAADLPIRDLIGTSDPYVKVFLAEYPQAYQQTKVLSRNLNPNFQQILSIPGHSMRKHHDMTLVMQVMDYDRFSADDPIGEVMMPMKNVKFEKKPVYWKHLQRPTISREQAGEIMLTMCYLENSNKLTVTLLKARDLHIREKIGSADSYAKLWLVQKGTKLEKRKTTVKPQTLCPTYNEMFTFSVPGREKLEKEINLVISVMDYEPVSSNEEIGHCVLGMLGCDTGINQWKQILNNPDCPVTAWHKLSRW